MATSALNPNAPIFVPSAYRAVECFSDPQIEEDDDGSYVHENGLFYNAVTEGKENNLDLVALGWLKWRKPRGELEVPRYCDKAPKFVNMKVKPRSIQQPR